MSTSIKDGGPAFPRPVSFSEEGGTHRGAIGMSLRDFFAAQALTSVLDSSGDLQTYYDHVAGSKGDNNIPSPRAVAKYSYELADAMLAAREAKS